MSIVGHAEPMDYDIYARDDYYFGYSSAEFKALIAALDDTIDPPRASRSVAARFSASWPTTRSTASCSSIRAGYLERASAGLGIRQCAGRRRSDAARTTIRRRAAARRARRRAAQARVRFAGVARCAAARGAVHAGRAPLRRRYFGGPPRRARSPRSLAATAIVFVIVQIVPGDPVRYMMGLQADPDSVAATRHQLGLDVAPAAALCALGRRIAARRFRDELTPTAFPWATSIAERLQVSLAARRCTRCCSPRRSPFRSVWSSAARRGRAERCGADRSRNWDWRVPNFWLGMLLVMLFAVGLALGFRGRLSRLGGRIVAGAQGARPCRRLRSPCRRPRSWRACCAAR